jgi:drug/metabolite transporter (DMT)-like permease
LKHRLLDFAFYLAVAVCLVGIALVCLILSISRSWYTFIIATIFLGVFVVKMYGHHRKSRRLWLLLATLFTVHVAGYAVFLKRLQQFPDIVFLLTVPIEIVLIAAIVKVCLGVTPKHVSFS